MEVFSILGLCLRIFVVIVGLVSLLSLANAKAKRGSDWTPKLKDIWLCHFLLTYTVIQANVEHLARGTTPTGASLFFLIVFGWTIKATRRGDMYVNPPEHCPCCIRQHDL